MPNIKRPIICRWCLNTGEFTFHLAPARLVANAVKLLGGVNEAKAFCNSLPTQGEQQNVV